MVPLVVCHLVRGWPRCSRRRIHLAKRHREAEEDEGDAGESEIEEAGERKVDGLVGEDQLKLGSRGVAGGRRPLISKCLAATPSRITVIKPTAMPTVAANNPNRARAWVPPDR